MNPETFFDNFGMLADVPNGVKKLRELILQLAVQGKLVAQDETDEPASALLERNNLNQMKSSSSIKEDELSYDLPKGWVWARLGRILTLEYGKSLPKSKRVKEGEYAVYGSNGVVGYHDKFLIDKSSIIVGRKGSCGALNISFEPSWATDVSYYVIPPSGIDLKFAYILLKSLNLERLGKGIKPGLNRNEAYELVLSLPPSNEQHRIVTRVNQLMTLCDELEALQKQKSEARTRLNSAALSKLTSAPDGFIKHWQRISDNFDLFYDAPETVGELRKAILQLAVMGKLVAQDENDEPASVLLERIKVEKERLVKEKKIKKINTLPLVKSYEESFKLPDGWEFIRLGEIVQKLGAGSTPRGGKAIYQNQGIKFLRSQNVWNRGLFLQNVAHIPSEIHQRMNGTVVKPSDILLNITGASIGRCAIVSDNFDEGNVSQHVTIVRLIDKALRYYVHICLISPLIQDTIMDVQVGISREGLSMSQLKDFLIPIPPFEEQRRIVARVDQLMALCDELEAKLARQQKDGAGLMEAVVGGVLRK